MAERPSPSSIAICSLIALHSDPSSPLHDLQLSREKRNSLTKFLDDIATADAASSDTNLAFLLSKARDELGDEITCLLEETLEMAIESVDSLIDLMDSLRVALVDGLVEGVNSIFLRKVCLGFEELSFESVAQLWANLDYHFRNLDNSAQIQPEKSTDFAWHPSNSQMERLMRKGCVNFELGNDLSADLSFENTELKMRKLIRKNPDFCAAYFLRFLNCLQNNERVGAIRALHQYFDQAMVQTMMPKDILQFSAVLLAMTHSSFGGVEMSLMATEEAVRVAQQSKERDASCVAFALGWLYKNDCSGHADRLKLLQRCAARASQGQLRPLVSGANLSLSTHLVSEQTPTFTPLSWITLLRANTIQSADNLVNLDLPTHLSQVPNEGLESMGKQAMVAAVIWTSFNLPALAGLSSVVALEYNHHLFKGDVFGAIENISLLSSHGFSLQFLSKDSRDSAGRKCVFVRAVSFLIRLQGQLGFGSDNLRGPIFQRALLLLLEWSVNRCDLEDAKAISDALDASIRDGRTNSTQLALDFGIQRCRLLCREKDWQNARTCVKQLLDICSTRNLKTQHARVLFHQAIIELEADPKHFIAALPPLLAALTYCEKHEINSLKALGLSILAKVHLRLQRPKHALAILTSALPFLQQHENPWFQADALLTISKCYIRLMENQTTNASKNATSAEMRLLQCRILFEDCHDFVRLKEVYYLQAQLYSTMNRAKERDVSSHCFVAAAKYLYSDSISIESSFLPSSLMLQAILERGIPFGS